jgi:hydrogenase expression/formation protein HypE
MAITALDHRASRAERIVLDHGSGTRLSRDLVSLMVDWLGDVHAGAMEDSAIMDVAVNRIAVTTDSFVVTPHIFGNGDIGKIAVCGTVNDIAVSGARPLYLTLALIIETGLPFADLKRILTSIRDAARAAGVKIIAGDTKVVAAGEADKIFINTTGIGVFERAPLRMSMVRPGDRLIISGQIGNHSVHLLSIREGLGFETRVLSDCTTLNIMIDDVLQRMPEGVHSIRDVTRGGLSAVMHEYAQSCGCTIRFEERQLPIQHETLMATDMLGISPIHLANEGCLALFVAPERADAVVDILRCHPEGRMAGVIGEVIEGRGGTVEMIRRDGTLQRLDELIGAEMPRLC